MKKIAPNVYLDSVVGGCNVGFVTTKEGIVMIDTPIRPSEAMKWRQEIEKKGELRYIINTEEHADHCHNSCFFEGVLITSEETREKLSKKGIGEAVDRVRRIDQEGVPLMKSFNWRTADISFTGDLNIYLGDHTFKLFSLPGHSTGGIGVYIPEEGVVFATDCVFHRLKTWLQEAIPDQWFESLEKLGELDLEIIVPGHGDICHKDYLLKQTNIIKAWVDVVKSSIGRGLTKEESIEKISQPDPYPKQIKTPMTEAELNIKNITRLYQLYS